MQTAHVAQQKKKKIKKWEENLNGHFSEDVQMAKSTHKDVQHHLLLEKYK